MNIKGMKWKVFFQIITKFNRFMNTKFAIKENMINVLIWVTKGTCRRIDNIFTMQAVC